VSDVILSVSQNPPVQVLVYPSPTVAVGVPTSQPQQIVQLPTAIALGGQRVVASGAGGLIYADNSILAHSDRVVGVTRGAVTSPALAEVITSGLLTDSAFNWAFPAPIYLGQNGVLTQTLPAFPTAQFFKAIGVAVSATTIVIDLAPSIQLN